MKCYLNCLQEDGAVHAPLVMACKHGSLEVIKLLLKHNADVHKVYGREWHYKKY